MIGKLFRMVKNTYFTNIHEQHGLKTDGQRVGRHYFVHWRSGLVRQKNCCQRGVVRTMVFL
jgi:hypothetical protein